MAVAGHNRANRIGPEPMTAAELAALQADYPDGPSIIRREPRG